MRRRDLLLAAPALAACATISARRDVRHRDVALVAEALSLHPGVYRYLTPRQLDDGLARLDEAWANEALDARFLALSRFLSTLACGHTFCNPLNQKKAARESLFERRRSWPFTFVWLDGTPIVTSAAGPLARGTRLVSIDGVRSDEVLATLLPFTRADGRGAAKRRAQLGVRGDERYEAFELFHALLFPVERTRPLQLEVVPPGSATATTVEVAPADRPPRTATPTGDQPVWDWSVDAQGIALLRMPSWALYDSKWDWNGWLSERLDSLRGARGLVVDLRDNEGGLDCGNALLSRLSERDLTLSGYARRVRFRTTPPTLDPFLDTWDDSFRQLGVGARDVGGGFFELEREQGVELLPAVKPRVTTKTAVLIGPVNSSATFQFAARCRDAGLATLVGQPTGGNRRGINGGSFFFVRLPCGLEFDLPLVGTFPATEQPDAGVEPDVLVTPTAADLAANHDATLETARRLLLAA